MRFQKSQVLVTGEGILIQGILKCLLGAGHHVWFWPNDLSQSKPPGLQNSIMGLLPKQITKSSKFHLINKLGEMEEMDLAVAITPEDLNQKRGMVIYLEKSLGQDCLIAINSESIPLSHIQQKSSHPERVIGMNWTEPANTSFFLELISNKVNREEDLAALVNLAKEDWGKDPYVLKNDEGIRSKLLAALVREAFYLIENGYVGVEDIDRACRNDSGYYLPFAGNCRYMDLMGTSVYGTVMADLNPELSNASHIPDFFMEILEKGGKGMENGNGFYQYNESEKKMIYESFEQFNYQIKELMSKYPFE